MLNRIRVGLLLAFFILISSLSFSQVNWPSTLLWRISGNGLSRPSYLYGTMHLQDKRLFNFGDSIYQSLEKVEGFALEINFKEYLDSMFLHQFQRVERAYLQDDEVEFNRKKIDKSADSILKEFGIESNKITKKELKKIRDFRLNKMVQRGEMQTSVDGYLYGVALRTEKWIGGIEDVADQMGLIDEMGSDLTPDRVLEPESELRKGLEAMINIYVKQDLQSLALYADTYDSTGWKDQLLTHRNIKMARRMDSLSAIRTMFFAVGAAHLPGDSGVIMLLRKRGFTVDPVYSSQKIPAENYTKKLAAVKWTKVNDSDSLFSIEMPGVPSDYNILGQQMQMKLFFDLTTMTMYFAGHTIGKFTTQAEADKMFENMAERMGITGKEIKKKNISKGDVHGIEGSFDIPAGSYTMQLLQKNNTAYILMVGSNKKSNLGSQDVVRFFSSFIPYDAVENKNWKKFVFKDKSASVMLPAEPRRNAAIDRVADGSSWIFNSYDHVDNQKGIYYLAQVRDIKEGYYLTGDSSYFALYEEDLGKKFSKLLKAERGLYKGFSSFRLEGIVEDERSLIKSFQVIRGNRVFILIAAGHPDADFSDAETCFNSLTFEEYPTVEIKTYHSEGFYTTATGPVKRKEKSETEDTEATKGTEKNAILHYLVHNPVDAVTYEIDKEPLSSLFWTSDDSSFLERQGNRYKEFNDSVLSKEMKYNGGLKSLDLLIQSSQTNNLKKLRLLVNGDTLYVVWAYIPAPYINGAHHHKFFDDFRITKELKPSIYTDKSEQLLRALQTKDSAEFQKAYAVLSQVDFGKNHLPQLHKALLQLYMEAENDYDYSVHDKLIQIVEELNDSSTIHFIKGHYNGLTGEKEVLKYPLLNMLAQFQTAQSYSILKELLLKNLPASGSLTSLTWSLRDSLELTSNLYPEILTLHKDSAFRHLLVHVTNVLLDSNMISLKEVLPYRNIYIEEGRKLLQLLKDSTRFTWEYSYWIELIGKFNDKESNALVQQFLKLDDLDFKHFAVIALAKNNQPVDPKEIEKLGADKAYRLTLYDELKEIGKQHLFPSKYATQKYFAETQLYEIAIEEIGEAQIVFIGERTVDFLGKKQKFYLFKVSSEDEEEGEVHTYLGIAGPYDPGSKELVSYGGGTDLFWNEAYNKTLVDKHFKEHLKNIAEYLKEDPADSTKK